MIHIDKDSKIIKTLPRPKDNPFLDQLAGDYLFYSRDSLVYILRKERTFFMVRYTNYKNVRS